MVGLGVIATGSWFALTSTTEKPDSAHATVSLTCCHSTPSAVAENEAATPRDYGRILAKLYRETNSPEQTRAMLEALQSWAVSIPMRPPLG